MQAATAPRSIQPQLAFHERKRLKRVNLLDYDKGKGRREGRVMQRYHIVARDDYNKYY